MQEKKLILLIDDDSVCNSINQILLKRKFKDNPESDFEVRTFQKPAEGFKFLTNSLRKKVYRKILVLLDINMPSMTGWEFLDEYSSLPKHETQVFVYILSSSINKGDKNRMEANPIVAEFISKPITGFNTDKFFAEMK